MGIGRRIRQGLGFVTCCVPLLVACKKTEAPVDTLSITSSAAVTPDALKPGELSEGKESVFGIRVPKGAVVVSNIANLALVSIEGTHLEPVANYFRDRTSGGTASVGAARTILEQTHARGNDTKDLRITIWKFDHQTVRIELRDITPPKDPLPPSPENDELRWKKAGLTKDGKVLDKSKFE